MNKLLISNKPTTDIVPCENFLFNVFCDCGLRFQLNNFFVSQKVSNPLPPSMAVGGLFFRGTTVTHTPPAA